MRNLKKFNLDRNAGGKSWSVRRRIIVLSLVFCASIVAYITFKNIDTRTAETTVQSAFYLAAAIIGSYCFAATWEDKSRIDIMHDDESRPFLRHDDPPPAPIAPPAPFVKPSSNDVPTNP